MRSETVEEFLKRGGKIKHLKETVGAKIFSAQESGSKMTPKKLVVRVQ